MDSDDLTSILPGLGPGVVVSLLAGLLAGGIVGRTFGVSRLLGAALVISFGFVLAATVTPTHGALVLGTRGPGACDLGRVGLASLSELRHLDERGLNVALFVPLGFCLGLLPRSRAKTLALAGAFLLPAAIELTQLVVVDLGRGCQSSDVIDNLTGLVLGLAAGTIVGYVAARVSRRRRRADGADPATTG